jgi:hypothetical protein
VFEPTNHLQELEKSPLTIMEELTTENKRLHDEKANLMEIEAKLQAKVAEEVESKKAENQELRVEVDILKKRCEELTQFLNKKATEPSA